MDSSAKNLYFSNMTHIENYNLFGESSDLPDVVHCETIETRSLIHNWEFRPHRHTRLYQFLLVSAGGGKALIEEKWHPIAPGDLINVPMGVVHGFRFEPDTQGWVVTMTSELLEQSLHASEGLRPSLSRADIVRCTPEIRGLVRSVFDEYPNRRFARAHVLRSLAGVLAGLVARAITAKYPAKSRSEHTLQKRFEVLLDTHHLRHLGVSDYADLLAVTPTHLSRVMRRTTGRSASAAIEERLIREARRNLAFSNLSVTEVGYQLGFSDPACFSRVFKRATGQSPRAFRQNLER